MKIRNPINIVGGSIVGILAVSLLFTESKFIAYCLLPRQLEWLAAGIWILFGVLAVISFTFILRYFISMKSQTLVVYYLLSVLISTTAVIVSVYLLFLIARQWLDALSTSGFWESSWGIFLTYNASFLFFLFLLVIFSSVFSSLTKRKVKYIQHISKEIKTIEREGFGKTIAVIGDDEIAKLCISINHMSEKLWEKEQYEQEMEKKKNELITNVSHDLRSPLTSIIGYVNLLKKEGITDEEKFQEYIQVVDRRLQGLNLMINELFELTKLNAPDVKLNFEKQDFFTLFRHLVGENEILLQQQGLILEKKIAEDSFEMNLDTNRMVRVIQNLFDNIRKYAKENTKVGVSAEVKQDKLRIQMTNQVREPETLQVENVFERFYKGDLSRKDTESSGLGLAIVKRIVELHGGGVTARLEGDQLILELEFSR